MGKRFQIIRQDSTQKEFNYDTGDTSMWSIKWIDECDYEIQYASGMNDNLELREFMKGRKMYFRILEVQSDFYRLKINFKNTHDPALIDTIWRNKKGIFMSL